MKRQANIELLRLLSIFMIILIHVYGPGLGYKIKSIEPFQKLILSFIISSVDCFIFISGYFGIRLKIKSVLNLSMQALFYSLGSIVVFVILGRQLVFQDLLLFFPILSGYWWFLISYVFLMILSPMLNYGIEKLEKKQLIFILFGLFAFNCISGFIFRVGTYNAYSIVNFIAIYVLAGFIKKYNITLKKPFILYTLSCMSIYIIIIIYSEFIKDTSWGYFYDYNNPIVICSAVFLFMTFQKIKLKSDKINSLAKLSFGALLFHSCPYMVGFLVRTCAKLAKKYNNEPFLLGLYLFLFALVLFIGGLAIEKIRQIIFNPLLNRIANIKFIKNLT